MPVPLELLASISPAAAKTAPALRLQLRQNLQDFRVSAPPRPDFAPQILAKKLPPPRSTAPISAPPAPDPATSVTSGQRRRSSAGAVACGVDDFAAQLHHGPGPKSASSAVLDTPARPARWHPSASADEAAGRAARGGAGPLAARDHKSLGHRIGRRNWLRPPKTRPEPRGEGSCVLVKWRFYDLQGRAR